MFFNLSYSHFVEFLGNFIDYRNQCFFFNFELLLAFFLLFNLLVVVIFFSRLSGINFSFIDLKYIIKILTVKSINYFIWIFIYYFLYVLIVFFFYDFHIEFFTANFYIFFGKTLITFIFLSVLCFCSRFILFESASSLEFPTLIGFSFLFCLLLISSIDLLLMYFSLEALTFLLCILIATNCNSSEALEASIKYFVMSSFSSGIILYGIFWIYAVFKETNFFSLSFINSDLGFYGKTLEFPLFFIIIGFLVKIGAFPFSLWTPDIYEGSSSLLVFFIISLIKPSFIIIFSKLICIVFNGQPVLTLILTLSALGSFLIGAFGAYGQTSLKKFFAYTSLNQLGFILMSLSLDCSVAYFLSFFFLFVYILNNILFFSVVLNLYNSKNYFPIDTLLSLKGLSFFYPLSAIAVSISLFSFIGIPPLAGFFSKFFILINALQAKFFFSCLVAFFSNAISAFYYLRILKFVWFEPFNSLSNFSFYFLNGLSFSSFFIFMCSFFNLFFVVFLIYFL